MEDKKVLLSVKNLKVQFRVRGRILTAIRNISLDIYENESIAIVGESGSGKSVFTKTFAGMLDSNGFISQGSIIFDDAELSEVRTPLDGTAKSMIASVKSKLDVASKMQFGGAIYQDIIALEAELRHRAEASGNVDEIAADLKKITAQRVSLYNKRQTMDPSKEKAEIKAAKDEIKRLDGEIKALGKKLKEAEKAVKNYVEPDAAWKADYDSKMADLKAKHAEAIKQEITPEMSAKNEILAKEIVLSVARYPAKQRNKFCDDLVKAVSEAMKMGVDLDNEDLRSNVFDDVVFRVAYVDETETELHGHCILNLASVKYAGDWGQIRGSKIATVFQDPMTSLNPIITIGKQMSSIIMKHQGCSEGDARLRAIEMMGKVGIPNPASRYDDYPFQYSGGMRQRIVIAIALSCQPKILICDEPTTALDVTIQAQILQLFKDLQKEFGYTMVFITHDLGVVANVADRVAVLYAGQIVELGTVEEVFYDPRHPYTWALLSSLPQLAQRNTTLFSITGTPPSLYNEIVGDAFAPRNTHCLKIDTLVEPPMFKVTDTHYAKTWLLHEDAPQVDKPEQIQNMHEKLCAAYHIDGRL